jgi:AraC-like DNA-binding protein
MHPTADAPVWDLLLRGMVGGVLLFHVVQLVLPGPRPATRAALAMLSLSLIAYMFCQRATLLLQVPGPVIWIFLALCSSTTAWLWMSARALFDDRFGWDVTIFAVGIGMVALGLAAHAPRLEAMRLAGADPGPGPLSAVHALAMVGFSAATLWEVLRGWRDDLVEPRRAARRWVAFGISVYAVIALVVELAVRDRPVGFVLPALHVIGIGTVALALAVLVARRSLAAILGLPPPSATPPLLPEPAPVASVPPPPAPEPSPALQRLQQAMTTQRLYRREGLTVAALAADLDLGEDALRTLINQELGYRNFNDFLHHHRLAEATGRLIVEDLPILTIALDCGYGSIGPFNRAFRQRYGMTPTEYRAGARMGQPRSPG